MPPRQFSGCCFVLACLLTLVAMPVAVRAENVVVGVNMTNADRIDPAQQDAMLSAMKSVGVRVIRAGLAPGEKGIDFARRVYAEGIRIDLLVGFGGYLPGAPTRPYQPQVYPGMWGGHPLSYVDPDQFRAYFATLIDKLEAAGITLAAFEFGNEINWAAFNPEFPLPGEGRLFGYYDLTHDPEAKQVAKGFLQYLKVLAVLKEIRDHAKLNRHTPILTAGLAADEVPEGPMAGNTKRTDLVSVNATLDFMRAHGLDGLVDAYAVHVYPWGNGPGQPAAAVGRRARLAKYVLARCRPAGGADGKPCWITEWGFNNTDMACPINDRDRAMLVREMMGSFRPYEEQGRLVGLLYYAWNTDPWAKQPSPNSLYRCGALTESGHLALDAALLH